MIWKARGGPAAATASTATAQLDVRATSLNMKLRRQIHLVGKSVERAPPRVVAGAERRVLRVEVSAENEDLATVVDVGPFSTLRGTLDFVDLPPEAIKTARSFLALACVDGNPAHAFHVECHDPMGFSRSLQRWPMPVDIWLTMEPPSDPSVDPTDPWMWDASEQPELCVHSIGMHTLSEGS